MQSQSLEKIKEMTEKMEDILSNAKKEQRELTEEEEKVFNDLEKSINKMEKVVEAENKLKTLKEKVENISTVIPPVVPEEKANIVSNVNVKSNPPMWKSAGEFFMAIYNAGAKNQIDDRLLKPITNAPMKVSVAPDGGFLVGADIEKWLLDAARQESLFMDKVTKFTIGENQTSLSLPRLDERSRADGYRWGGVRAYWTSEGVTVADTKPATGKLELSLEKLLALCYVTDELLQSQTALESYIRTVFSSEIAFKFDEAIIEGNGNGKPLGVLNCPALVTVSKETGQTAATVVYKNILKMWNRLSARNRANAIWVMSQEVEEQLYQLYLATGSTGVPVFLPAGGISGNQYSTLFGRPIYICEHCSQLGTKGDIILMDPTDYIGITKEGLLIDSSIHVKFEYDINCFRFRYRFNGAPYTNYPIASKKNSNFTTSPYVTLETRS